MLVRADAARWMVDDDWVRLELRLITCEVQWLDGTRPASQLSQDTEIQRMSAQSIDRARYKIPEIQRMSAQSEVPLSMDFGV